MITIITSESVINWQPKTEQEKIINQIANIIKTRKGELAFKRDIGIDDKFIDKPVTQIKPVIVNEVTNVIMNNVSNVNIISIDLSKQDTIGDYEIKVVAEI